MQLLTELFPHQQAAFDKLKGLKVGALYMEQGTGKTRTMLEMIKYKLENGKIDRVLWFCPCSVKDNLREDIIYHCGEFLNFIQIAGIESISGSDRLYLQLLGYAANGRTMLIVDESNLVKNPWSKRCMRITEISTLCRYRYILNGTPVSRTEADMFAQWYILDWEILGYKSYYSFAANHIEYVTIKLPGGRKVCTNQIACVLNKDYLTRKIAPYTYQIKKSECMKLPEKSYIEVPFEMDESQRSHYETVREEILAEMNEDDWDPTAIFKLFTALQLVTAGRWITQYDKLQHEPFFTNYLKNPRIQALKKTLLKNIGDEKVIIFAKYNAEVQDIENLLDDLGITYTEFTGRIRPRQRQINRKKFMTDVQVLVANKNCGAYGLNLQFCHNVIFYDHDFQYATRVQAEDRVHRIGQREDVVIYDLIATDSIDTTVVSNLKSKECMVESFKKLIHKWKNKSDTEIADSLKAIPLQAETAKTHAVAGIS